MSSKSSRTDLPETVLVGRVLRPHGVRGEVVVEVLSDVPARFQKGSRLTGVREGVGKITLTVAAARVHKTGAVVRFEGYEDRDRAGELRGLDLEIPRAEVPKARTWLGSDELKATMQKNGVIGLPNIRFAS